MDTEKSLVGRKKEIEQLTEIESSKKSEFVVIYGRRRVGKTFLVREFFNHDFDFYISGLANATTKQQLFNFHTALSRQSSMHVKEQAKNWLIAFQSLIDHLESIEKKGKIRIFFDEMPWLDTKKSDFILALEHFWNSWASNRKDVILIACGSAASWMINTLINHTGGLHNRVTQKIKLEPFTLKETEELLEQKKCVYDRYQITQLYMAMGGIPYYLEAVKANLSAAQNIQSLFFDSNGFLHTEFLNLYRSLFAKHEIYEEIVEILSNKQIGMTRSELVKFSKLSSGGTLTKILMELELSGFIQSYTALDSKNKNTLYRLSDYYSAFYLRFIKNKPFVGEDVWINLIENPMQNAWQGFTFEQICLDHIPQIKQKLGISGVQTRSAAWRGKFEEKSVQIDLLIDRRDQVVNLCEAKFSLSTYSISKEYAEKLRTKISVFKQVSKTKKSVFLTLITTFGLERNKNASGLVVSEVLLDDLFA